MRKILFSLFILVSNIAFGQISCNNWLSLPSNPSYFDIGQLNVTGDQITVEATFNRTIPYTGGTLYAGDLVSKHQDPTDINYLLRPNEAEITTTNGYFRTPDICQIVLNKTYHVAMVYDGSSLKFYRNGFLMSQIAATGNLYQNVWPTRIGYYYAQIYNESLIGYINEVRIWNVARTQTELRTYMNASLPNPTSQPGLLAYYTFDNLINKQGNSAWNGTLNGNASINSTNPSCAFVADSCDVAVSDSTIINDYTEVLGFDICKNELKVADATKYNPGDTVMIIQMKGAVIDSGNTANFGNITNYHNCGNYEMNIIKQKNGNSLSLLNVLERQYDIPNGKVQLIRVPFYDSYAVNNTLTCLPWDGSKGGVLVLNAKNSVTLNADIDVSARGFKGGDGTHGVPVGFNCYQNQFFYPPNTDFAAGKGEGIALLLSDKADGKGKYANGGGGGNSHNAGGGGGSNAASGGFGGYEFEGTPCDGTVPFDNRGIGGASLTYNNASNKIFLGGGGGAGHANNPELFYPTGGNGGGICLLNANIINGNGRNIYANGDNGLACSGYGATGCHEGMGGGGGAGAIILNINSVSSALNAAANGGKGGDMVQAGNLRVGPGGGGGAGVVWLSNLSIPANINISTYAGNNGVCTAYANDPWGTTPGQNGTNILGLKLPVDTVAFKPNIDSVRIIDSAISCSKFSFKGHGFTNKSSIVTWNWNFGDGTYDSVQNTSHSYQNSGTFNVILKVADVNGCVDSISVPVTPSLLTITKNKDTAICGSHAVQLSVTGGTTYSWSPSSTLSNANIYNPIATPLFTTTYYVTVTSVNGCTKNDSIKIVINSVPVITKSNDTTICKNTPVQLFASGGSTYAWSPASSLNNPNISNPIATPSQSTTYQLTVMSSNGCQNTDSIKLTLNPALIITKSDDTTICPNNSVNIFATGGSSYLWSPANSLDNASSSSPVASPKVTTTYQVIIKDGYSCSYNDSVKVSVTSAPAFSIIPDGSICNGSSKQLNAAGGDTYEWTPAASLNDPNISNPIASPTTSTIYSVTIHKHLCNFTDVFTTKLDVIPLPLINALSSNDLTCSIGSSQLSATGAANYTWSPASGLNSTNIANPIATPLTSTLYTVKGIDANGCSNFDTVTVKADFNMNALYLLPNSFTPNGDGLNDCFGIKYWGTVQQLDFSIYNRFGERVFHTNDSKICWDGRYKQEMQASNVYVYVIKAKTACGLIERKGTVTLIQ